MVSGGSGGSGGVAWVMDGSLAGADADADRVRNSRLAMAMATATEDGDGRLAMAAITEKSQLSSDRSQGRRLFPSREVKGK